MGKSRQEVDEPEPGSFDPAQVPPYPVITLTGADDPENVTVDGEPIAGEDAYDRALALCAQRADELGGAVRVRGIDRDGIGWPMVVTSVGELHDISDHPDSPTAQKPRPSRRKVLLIAGGAVLLGGAGTAGIFAYRALSKTPETPPPPQYPGRGANVPALPPEGVATVAEWAVTIDSDTTPVMLDGQRIALVTSNSQLVIVDALTGQLQWSGVAEGSLARTRETTVGDVPALASYSEADATLWPLDDTSTPSPQTLKLEQGRADAVITSSPAPLWVLERQTATFLAGTSLALVDVPVPALAAGTHARDAVAVTSGAWVQITAENAATEHVLDDVPNGAEPLYARVLGDAHLAVFWTVEGSSTVTLHELPGGAHVAQLEGVTVRNSTRDEPRPSPDGTTWVWHNLLIAPEADTPLIDLTTLLPAPDTDDGGSAPFEVASVSDNVLWGYVEKVPTRYDLTTGAHFSFQEDATLPLAESRDGELVYIVASRLEQLSLYALPATFSAPSDGGQG
ncbi:MAG TPA: hypothetical protein VK046_02925 [Actinomycetaceae bacterium]|nr:hypothetical protein [Actinomycetaceae bacterium]